MVCDYYVTSYVAVSSGVNFNFLRMKYTFTDRRRVEDFLEEANVPVSRRLKATNIEIPLKAKFRLDVAESLKAYAEAGVGLSFNCKDYAKDSYSFYWVASEGENYVDCTNQYRPLQFSMIFGLGAEYEINRDFSVFAQLSFDHAFSNAFVSILEKQTGSIIRNNYIGIEIGIMYYELLTPFCSQRSIKKSLAGFRQAFFFVRLRVDYLSASLRSWMSTRRSYSVGSSIFTPPMGSMTIWSSGTPNSRSSTLILLQRFSDRVWL